MPRSVDESSPGGDADVDADENRTLGRQRKARRLSEQTWREFLVSLAVRTVAIIAIVLAVFWLLRFFVGR